MKFLSVEDVAERLGCSKPKVRELFEAGRLRGVNLGGKNRKVWHISEQNLQRFMDGESQTSTQRGRRALKRIDSHVENKWF